ncbi:MAG: hypothetical protein ACRBFS_25765 [Aureispira sp.]
MDVKAAFDRVMESGALVGVLLKRVDATTLHVKFPLLKDNKSTLGMLPLSAILGLLGGDVLCDFI